MSFDRGADHPLWRIACRRGWRRSIRRVLGAVQLNHGAAESQAKKPYWSGDGGARLKAEPGQHFGIRKEAVRQASEVGREVNEQHETPAEAGREQTS